jgi:hypothetical protein
VQRRRLVASLVGLCGLTGLAGCDALPVGTGSDATADVTAVPPPRTASAGDAESVGTSASGLDQTVTVANPNPTGAYVTVVVEPADENAPTDATASFVRSVDVVAGERRNVPAELPGEGPYRVLVETAAGLRASFDWAVDATLDGLVAVLGGDDVAFRRTVRCGTDCSLARVRTAADLPLVGDGSGRWYAPASVVLRNPGGGTATSSLAVVLDGRTVLDAGYSVPAQTALEVPVAFRSGTYEVGVETEGGVHTGVWRVPEEPSRVVDLSDLSVGCGPANTELRVVNDDDREHRVDVAVHDADRSERLYSGREILAPAETSSVVPVASSGHYAVRVEVDGDAPFWSAWWSCPPRGPATVLVDATGRASFSQSRP